MRFNIKDRAHLGQVCFPLVQETLSPHFPHRQEPGQAQSNDWNFFK